MRLGGDVVGGGLQLAGQRRAVGREALHGDVEGEAARSLEEGDREAPVRGHGDGRLLLVLGRRRHGDAIADLDLRGVEAGPRRC